MKNVERDSSILVFGGTMEFVIVAMVFLGGGCLGSLVASLLLRHDLYEENRLLRREYAKETKKVRTLIMGGEERETSTPAEFLFVARGAKGYDKL